MMSESLWNCYREEIDDVDNNASGDKSFKYKIKIIEKTEARPARPAQTDPDEDGSNPPQLDQQPIPPLNTEVTIPLKYLSSFWSFKEYNRLLQKKKKELITYNYGKFKT